MTTTPPTLDLPADAACLGCGYSLQQLTVPRCPECGRRFDPADVTSTANTRHTMLRRRKHNPWPAMMFGLVAVLTTFTLVAIVFPLRDQRMSAAAVGIGLGFWARSIARRQIIHSHLTPGDHRDRRVSKWLAIALIAVGVVTSVQTSSCCHGSLVAVGPIVITRTGDEGMCRNYLRLGSRHRVTETVSWYWGTSL